MEERAKAAAQVGGLKIAGAASDAKQADAIGVVLSVDKDEATQRAERDKEAAAKRMQNVLPAWHLKSTISGDLTALGIQENARVAEESREPDRLPSSNDAILRGLVKAEEPPMRLVTEDTKPVLEQQNHEADCMSTLHLSVLGDQTVLQITIVITPHWRHRKRHQLKQLRLCRALATLVKKKTSSHL